MPRRDTPTTLESGLGPGVGLVIPPGGTMVPLVPTQVCRPLYWEVGTLLEVPPPWSEFRFTGGYEGEKTLLNKTRFRTLKLGPPYKRRTTSGPQEGQVGEGGGEGFVSGPLGKERDPKSPFTSYDPTPSVLDPELTTPVTNLPHRVDTGGVGGIQTGTNRGPYGVKGPQRRRTKEDGEEGNFLETHNPRTEEERHERGVVGMGAMCVTPLVLEGPESMVGTRRLPRVYKVRSTSLKRRKVYRGRPFRCP